MAPDNRIAGGPITPIKHTSPFNPPEPPVTTGSEFLCEPVSPNARPTTHLQDPDVAAHIAKDDQAAMAIPSGEGVLAVAFDSLHQRQAGVVETPQFKRWFEGSRVTWEGLPLKLYHGTAAEFRSFRQESIGQNFKDAAGYFFTNNTSHDLVNYGDHQEIFEDMTSAGAYAKQAAEQTGGAPHIIAAFVNLQNPLVIEGNFDGDLLSRIETRSTPAGSFIRDEVVGRGHDGLIVIDHDIQLKNGQPEILVVATLPTQIKSAIGNCGSFDPTSDDVTC